MSNWKKIWDAPLRVDKFVIEVLLKANGFDEKEGGFSASAWLEYVEAFYQKLGLDSNSTTLYEVGCGAGAFLYPFERKGGVVAGMDYSKALIELAARLMPARQFVCSEALALDPTEKFDVVVSHSLFHYLQNLNEAEQVAEKMIAKANRVVAFLDLNDARKEAVYVAERKKKISPRGIREKVSRS